MNSFRTILLILTFSLVSLQSQAYPSWLRQHTRKVAVISALTGIGCTSYAIAQAYGIDVPTLAKTHLDNAKNWLYNKVHASCNETTQQLTLVNQITEKQLSQAQTDIDTLKSKEEIQKQIIVTDLSNGWNTLQTGIIRFTQEVNQKLDALASRLDHNNKQLERLRNRENGESEKGKAPQDSADVSNISDWAVISKLQVPPAPLNEVAHKLKKEFNKFDQSLTFDSAYQFYTTGKTNMEKLLTGRQNEIQIKEQRDYLDAILSLIWFLYGNALLQEQGFSEGTFVLEDKEFIIYNFLMGYAKKMNSTIKDTLEDPALNYSNNPFAYSRASSHYQHLKKYRAYGIEIRYGQNGWPMPFLPAANKCHLLFGKINADKNLIYIKPENDGLCMDGLLRHTGGYLMAQGRKTPMIREGFKMVGYDIGTDDDENNRKERVPAQFITDFTTILNNEKSISSDVVKTLGALIKVEGIKVLTYPEVEGIPAFQELRKRYEELYNHLALRTGREVIFVHQELMAALQ